MFYEWLKIVMRIVFPLWYRKVYLLNKENIPSDKPVILACNHPNAFLDAIVVSTFIDKRQVHFLVRSDVFNTALKRWILKQMNQIPIYRIEEGWNNLKKNKATFTACITLLGQKKMLLVFSEGNCVQEKRLRPLRKGTARIAMETESAFAESPDLQIVPVGINYSSPRNPGEEVLIKFGKPIPANKYMDQYKEHPATAFKQFNPDLKKAMEEQLIIIPHKRDEAITELVLKMTRNSIYHDLKRKRGKALFNRQKNNAAKIAAMDPERKKSFKKEVAAYEDALNENGLTDDDLLKGNKNKWLLPLALLPLAPVYLTGAVLNFFPYFLASSITKSNVRAAEFFSSVKVGLSIVLYLLYYTSVFLVIGFCTDFLLALMTPLLFGLGIFSLYYHGQLLSFIQFLKINKVSEKELSALRKKRRHILDFLK